MKQVGISDAKIFRLQAILVLFVIVSLVTGCRPPWQPPPDDEDFEVVDQEAISNQINGGQDNRELPPALVEIDPLPNSVINLNQPITFYFNQSMDASSVEAAIHFEPRVSGRFDWETDQTLTFTPDQLLMAGSQLQLSINTLAQAANRKNLQSPVEVLYRTAEKLRVSQIVPADGSENVDPESVIFVTFNQPVVPLGDGLSGESAFTLSPEVPGHGAWLNTSTYIFTPQPSMDGGEDYTIMINPDLMAVSGAGLGSSEELASYFSTTQPAVLSVYPPAGERLSLDGPVEIQFNVRMDPESVVEYFSLTRSGGLPVAGHFEWEDDQKRVSFFPTLDLARNVNYTIRLAPEAKSVGGLQLIEGVRTDRLTFRSFSVDRTISPEFQSYYNEFGQYQIQFTTPINRTDYLGYVNVDPDISMQSIFLSDNDRSLYVSGYFQPETLYTITLDADLEDVWGGRLGSRQTFNFTTPPASASFSLAMGYTSHDLLFVPAQESEFILQATNLNTLQIDLAPISVNDLITLLHPENYEYRQIFLPEELESSTRNLDLTPNIREVLTIPLRYQGNPLSPGVYYLGLSSPDVIDEGFQAHQRLLLVVSENNLVMKISPEQVFLWTAHLGDYAPLEDVPVSVYNTEGDIIARGRTEPDGLFISDFSRIDDPFASFIALVGEPGQDDFAFSISTWDDSYAFYEMGINQNPMPPLIDAYIYTDRPIYRPGDMLNFKAVIFARENGMPISPEFDAVNVAVYGEPGKSGIPVKLYSERLNLSNFGTVSGSVDLPIDSPTGAYRIDVSHDEELIQTHYFDVAAYRKPDIDLSVRFSQAENLLGEPLAAEAQAEYFFGLPANNQTYQYNLYREETSFHLPGYQVGPLQDWWLMPMPAYFYEFGVQVGHGEGLTDEGGHVDMVFNQNDLALDEVSQGHTQLYRLEVVVTDQSGFPVSQRDSMVVHPETFYIGVKPEAYFGSANTSFEFSLVTVDWDQRPVEGVEIEAVFEAISWEVVETNNYQVPYRYESSTTPIASASPVTDGEGRVSLSFTPPDPGPYRLALESGNARTEVLVWVSGPGSALWPRQPQNQIQLTPDRESYQPGQVARVFFPNPFNGPARALITLERGKVMETWITDVVESGHTLSFPINQDSLPNLYLNVFLFGENKNGKPDYRQGIFNLPIEPVDKALNLDLSINPALIEPGEDVSVTLRITDSRGNPVQGEFSIAVVDKAQLALVPRDEPDIRDALFGEQPLAVQTSHSLKTYASQLALRGLDHGMGGFGDLMEQPTVREDFPDTAFWRADIITAVDGTAQISMPMPDSLTTWVVEVRGLADDYRVGQATVEILTQKPLMIIPVTPRFLVDGDVVELAANVFNNSDQDLDVLVSLQASGFILEAGDNQQEVNLPAGASDLVIWRGLVDSVELLDLVFLAESGNFADASKSQWGDLSVSRYLVPYTFSTAGQIGEAGERLELISLPKSSDPSSGELRVSLYPSLLTTLVDDLQTLDSSANNQPVAILSRLLANLNTYSVLQKLGIESQEMQTNLTERIDAGVNQILETQNIDGGWSWQGGFDSEVQSDPFITAYVLMGLQQASDAGLVIGPHFSDPAENFLGEQILEVGTIESGWRLDRLAFQVYVLRNSAFEISPAIDILFARHSELSPWALGLLALTLDEWEVSNARVNTLLANLEGRAVRSATGVHWRSNRSDWMMPGTPIFNTAASVYALAQLDPASTSVPLALRYLMAHHSGTQHFSSDFESAWVLMAVAGAVQGTGDYQADFEFKATLNNRVIAEGSAGGLTSLTAINSSSDIGALFPDSPNTLLIERDSGAGTLYYRADLQTAQPAAAAEAINQGISLQREYFLASQGCPGGDDCQPIEMLTLDPADPSQRIKVTLTVSLSQDMYHFILEDFIPAGTEIIDPRLLTSQMYLDEPIALFNPRHPFTQGWGWWYFNRPQLYDDHIRWTADFVRAGTYVLTYELMPYQRGDFQVIPARAWQYYFPEVQGTSAGNLFLIE